MKCNAATLRTAMRRLRFESLEDRRLLAGMLELLKDINPGAGNSQAGEFIQIDSVVFFTADDGVSGEELWKTNGTEAGTVLIKDIRPGLDASAPHSLVNVGGTLYFSANDGTSGYELWKSDGTAAGTVRVKDIRPGIATSGPGYLTDVLGTLFFQANDGTSGEELWKSNGTEAGTVRVKDILPGFEQSFPEELTNVNGTLYFRATGEHNQFYPGVGPFGGYELWKSDGTEAGTVRVKDINPGPPESYPINLTNVSGTLYFHANDGTNGRELWKTDGTPAGTVLVKNINPFSADSEPRQLVNVNGTLYFRANDGTNGTELWKSNGSTAGTLRVLDINPGTLSSNPDKLTNVNGTLFFSASVGTSGRELWRTNGTAVGTVLVKDIFPGTSNSYPDGLTNVNGAVYFHVNDGTSGNELWRSDGTAAGTLRIIDLRPGGDSSFPRSLANIDGTLYFRAGEGVHGFELWVLRPEAGDTSLAISATSANKNEGNSSSNSFTFTVTRSGTLTGTTTVNYAVTGIAANPAAASDFIGNVLPTGSVTFTPGQTSKVISVRVRGDVSIESNETFRVTLSSPTGGAMITTASATGTIRNDDVASLAIAAASANKNEANSGNTPFAFTVTRSGSLTGETTVNYAVAGIGVNPTTANDFVGNAFPSGTVTFAVGQVTRVITIPVRGDTTVESNETFRVTLSGVSSGASITSPFANGVIRNDDTSLAIVPASANRNEDNSGAIDFTFTVTRSGLLTRTTTVDYAVTGIGANPAAANDFIGNVLPTGTVTFAPGETTKVISIPVRGEVTVEANEGFRVRLLNPSLGASITTAIASGLIRNDDV